MTSIKIIVFGVLMFCACLAFGQQESIYNDDPEQRLPVGTEKPDYGIVKPNPERFSKPRIEPLNWWIGMKDPSLTVLVYDKNIGDAEVSIGGKKKVKLVEVHRVQNPNYLFLELNLAKAEPGVFEIILEQGDEKRTYNYQLHRRREDVSKVQGLDNSDLIYLIMPDRFANGNPKNDSVEGMNQKGTNREKMFFRHGGDLKGISNKLDYLADLGVTALWINPVLENDQPYESYHGYAITDFYNIDRRFGSNLDYKEFVEACHDKGIKVIMDIIHNHVGDQHWFFQDLPDETWINQWDTFTRTTYRAPTLMDPHASKADRKLMTDGWFDHHMPDLNQRNPLLANYLIQNNIWWVEYSGQDAYRIDTYAYPDQEFMSEWGRRLQQEYPKLGLYGETWVHGPGVQAQFTEDNNLRGTYNSNLPAVTDFQMHYAINEALSTPMGWTEGVSRMYYTLAQDFLYEDAYRNVIFLDNHDLSRFFSVVGEDINKFKSGIAWLMTMRGIPSMYYGTEILMKNYTDPDGKVREDFPGGWAGDEVDKFTAAGRTNRENEVFQYIKRLANYRKGQPALHRGALTQFVPQDGVYTYFRHTDQTTVMVVMNTNDAGKTIALNRFSEFFDAGQVVFDVLTDQEKTLDKELVIPPFTTLIFELK